jgi:hypothetical protein
MAPISRKVDSRTERSLPMPGKGKSSSALPTMRLSPPMEKVLSRVHSLRAKSAGIEASHRTDAAREEVPEQGAGILAAVTAADADFAVQQQGDVSATGVSATGTDNSACSSSDRPPACRPRLGALIGALGGIEQTVASVPRPAGFETEGGRGGSTSFRVVDLRRRNLARTARVFVIGIGALVELRVQSLTCS